MALGLSVIVGGNTYALGGGTYSYWLREGAEEGFGPVEPQRFSEKGPLQHGDTDRGFLLPPRLCGVTLFINATSESDLETKRLALMRLFPASAALKLKKTQANAGVRQLDCYRVGWSVAGREGFAEAIRISFKASEPTWYNPTQATVTLEQPASGGFSVPMPVPFAVGVSTLSLSTNVAYTGSWLTYPTLRITGPVKDPVVTNTTTGDALTISATIAAGEYYDIDLSYNAKTVVDNTGTNRISTLSTDSDLASWHIAPPVDGTGTRNNTVTFTGQEASSATALRIQYYTRYDGI
jgi:hypothetical protein